MSVSSKSYIKNWNLAAKVYHARKKGNDPFPKNDIPTLKEMCVDVVAKNFHLYPDIWEIDDVAIQREVRTIIPDHSKCSSWTWF